MEMLDTHVMQKYSWENIPCIIHIIMFYSLYEFAQSIDCAAHSINS